MYTSHAEFLAEREAAEIARYADMSDADLGYWIERLTAEREEPLYEIKVSSYVNEKSATELFGYRRELDRRQKAAALAILSQATDFFCTHLMERDAPVTLQAAE